MLRENWGVVTGLGAMLGAACLCSPASAQLVYVDNLETNPQFTGWDWYLDAAAAWTTEQARSGTHSIRVDGTLDAFRAKWVKMSPQTSVKMRFHTKGGKGTTSMYAFDASTDWTQHTYVVRNSLAINDYFSPFFYYGSYTGGNGNIYVDDIEVSFVPRSEFTAWGDTVIASTGGPLKYAGPSIEGNLTPVTAGKLSRGENVRIVALGDSIMNDTTRAPLDGYIERAHAGSQVELITSVRGGTGAWWFAADNRVDSYVTAYNPDMVIIGGISHLRGGTSLAADVAALDSLVQQILARDIEVVLALDTSYMSQVDAIAAKYGIPSIDVKAMFDGYVQDSPLDVTAFHRDSIHMNHRGSEVLARAVAGYFNVPEPGAALLLAGAVSLLGRRRRA